MKGTANRDMRPDVEFKDYAGLIQLLRRSYNPFRGGSSPATRDAF